MVEDCEGTPATIGVEREFEPTTVTPPNITSSPGFKMPPPHESIVMPSTMKYDELLI
jgi:hypothetical protein